MGLDLACTYEETSFSLSIGDHLALYTDGLLEACSRAGEIYGFDRVKALFATKPNAREAMDVAVDFGQDDDITVLTLSRVAVGKESTTISLTPIPIPV